MNTSVDTSLDAFQSLSKDDLHKLRVLIWKQIKSAPNGMTCDEIENQCGLIHQTASARITELLHDQLIHHNGLKRKTRSGRMARVYFYGSEENEKQKKLFD